MWRVSALWAVASLALLAGLAGGAGAHPVAIPPPALGKAHDALETAYAEEELALFTLSDFASTSGRAEAPGALKRSQAALGDASSALNNGGLPSSVSGDVADAQDDDIGALTAIATGKLGAARQKIATALEAKDGAMLRIEAQLMSGYPSIGEYLIPVKDAGPTSIVSWGGRLWFTESNVTYNDSSVGVITNGKISETEIQNGGRNPNSLVVGPGGQIFVTEYTANKIGRVAVG